MNFSKEEHFRKLIEKLKTEGVYEQWKKDMRHGRLQKAADIVEKIYDKYGQKLDGDPESRLDGAEVREELRP